MKFTTVFLIAVICGAAFAAEDVFAELKESEFGSTLAETIQIQLSTSDNIEHVTDMVREVRSDLRAQLQEATDAHNEVADECRADFDSLQRKVDSAENQVTKFNRLYEIDHPVLVSRQEEKANKENELGEREATRDRMAEENQAAVAAFQGVVDEFHAVQQLMHTARAIIQEGFGRDASFLEVKTTTFNKLSSHIRNFKPLAKEGVSHGYQQVFNVLASIAERAPVQGDATMVDTILRIFDDIEENLENGLAVERTAEDQRLAAYDELSARIDGEINGLMAKIADLGRQILQLQFACTSYEQSRDTAQGQADDAEQLMADRRVVCNEEDSAYLLVQQRISHQITIAGNAIYLLENKRELLERYRA